MVRNRCPRAGGCGQARAGHGVNKKLSGLFCRAYVAIFSCIPRPLCRCTVSHENRLNNKGVFGKDDPEVRSEAMTISRKAGIHCRVALINLKVYDTAHMAAKFIGIPATVRPRYTLSRIGYNFASKIGKASRNCEKARQETERLCWGRKANSKHYQEMNRWE